MVERLPNLSQLSSDEKDELIVRLFDELLQLRDTVQELQNRCGLLDAENQQVWASAMIDLFLEAKKTARRLLIIALRKRIPNWHRSVFDTTC